MKTNIFLRWLAAVAGCVLLGGVAAVAQQGDKAGEEQPMLVPRESIPPAPVLSPEEALRSFRVQPGFRMELVASEPLVSDPVEIEFDPDGRLWVLEMRGFMPNVDGEGENEKVASLVRLEDGDGDGRMDRRTVFAEGLVMPRAFALVRGGVLLAEPPTLWFLRDADGDGKADERTVVATDYAAQADPKLGAKSNPEHASNGLMWSMDNWIYSANHTVRFRRRGSEWVRENTTFRGQWGLSQDDYGRLVYNSNSDQLRMDLVPSAYLDRNPHLKGASGLNVDPVGSQATWPIRVNPGINRGYQRPMLRDGRLARFTAACGPVVYRGDQFPAEYRGNVFVCEPAGNLIKRNIVEDREGEVRGRHAYEREEFLASTDERFRPVNASNGPDGALYLVDLYRGIIQHRIYITSYLRAQIEDRRLAQPVGLGRIWRVVHEGSSRRSAPPGLGSATAGALTAALAHPNGWHRDTAQRLLVEQAHPASVAGLRQLVRAGGSPLGTLHAMWTLEGLGGLDVPTLAAALGASNSKVRAAAVRLSEPFLIGTGGDELLARVLALVEKTDLDTRLQLALTLGSNRLEKARSALVEVARRGASNRYVRDAALSGLSGQELEFLEQSLAAGGGAAMPGEAELFSGLAKCVFFEGKAERVNRLLELAAKPGQAEWKVAAVLDGILGAIPPAPRGRPAPPVKPLRLPSEPAAFAVLRGSASGAVPPRVARLETLMTWPGKPGAAEEPEMKALTTAQQQLFEQGRELYVISCGACHQPHGNGLDGLAPPLAESEWVTGSLERLIRITLQGVRGPITVKGKTYQLEMPAFSVFEDEQLAALLTYVRREWGNRADPVDAAAVGRVRQATQGRLDAWSEPELLAIPDAETPKP